MRVRVRLTQSSLCRFRQVRAHCTPSCVSAVEQLKKTFGKGHAVTEADAVFRNIPLTEMLVMLKF